MGIGYIIGGIIWGVIWGCAAQAVITNKGYEDERTKYFWLGFFFSFIPLIVAATRPQYQEPFRQEKTLADIKREEEQIRADGGWKCDCGEMNYNYVSTCVCGRHKREVLDAREKAKTADNNPVKIVVPDASAAQQIKDFKELLDTGIISQEEFDAKKKQLLGL